MADWSLSQSSIDGLNTATPNLPGVPHPQSIEHRCLEIPLHKTWPDVPSVNQA